MDRHLERLLSQCWPGGGDRIEPAAVPWLRAWGPSRTTVRPPECTCAAGGCASCN